MLFPPATVIFPNLSGIQISEVTWGEPPLPPATLFCLVDQHRSYLLETRNALNNDFNRAPGPTCQAT